MDRSSLGIPGLCLLLVLSVFATGVAGPPAHVAGQTSVRGPVASGGSSAVPSVSGATLSLADPGSAVSNSPTFTSTHFVVTIHPNGSATWTFQYRTHLANDTQRRHFREFATAFETNDTALYRHFRSDARSLVGDGQNATGRRMSATNFSRRASVRGLNDNLGVVQMSFTWSSFARKRGDRLLVGDLFQGGLYLGPHQWLVFRTDSPLTFASADPRPNETSAPSLAASDSVTWRGPREFADQRPRLVFTTNATTGSGSATTGNGVTPSTAGGRHTPMPLTAVGALFLALVVVGGGAYWYRDRTRGERASTDDGTSPPEPSVEDPAADPQVEPAVTDEEMLPDDERVVRLLRENGGRMRQATIVEETDWSKSKVSMLLSEMEENRRISRLRVGRENVVSLPGHEPDAVGSE